MEEFLIKRILYGYTPSVFAQQHELAFLTDTHNLHFCLYILYFRNIVRWSRIATETFPALFRSAMRSMSAQKTKNNRVWKERPATLLFKVGDPQGRICAWEMRGVIPPPRHSRRALIETTKLELCARYTMFFNLPETLRTNDATTVLFLGGQKGDPHPIITWKKEEQSSRQTAGQRGCRPDGGWDNISPLKANFSSIPLTRTYLCMYRVFMRKKGRKSLLLLLVWPVLLKYVYECVYIGKTLLYYCVLPVASTDFPRFVVRSFVRMRMRLRTEACLRAAVWRDLGTTDCPVSLYSIILILIIGRTAYAREYRCCLTWNLSCSGSIIVRMLHWSAWECGVSISALQTGLNVQCNVVKV